MMNAPSLEKPTPIALLGDPVDHSLSPVMHAAGFRSLNLHYVYHSIRVTPGELASVQKDLCARGYRGWNLTMPLKTAALPLMDDLADSAALAGAVNTVVNEDGRLIGHNTDGTGFLRALERAGATVDQKTIVLLGAGGAASAILAEAALRGAAVLHVFHRENSPHLTGLRERIRHLKERTTCRFVFHPLGSDPCLIESSSTRGSEDHADQSPEDLSSAVREADILINATPVGMAPDTDRSLIVDPSLFAPGMTVADVIYHPRKTKLLALAEEAGCSICPGEEMLLYQGAEAFRLWTGREMPVDEIRPLLFGLSSGT